jgi:AcrR family transcriptional regulator
MRMNGHDRRRQQIGERIKKSALELLIAHGVKQVSMDEVARKADVSKVTIYKYFQSKDELFRQVINLYIDEILAGMEVMLAGDGNIVNKLKSLMQAQANAPQLAGNETLSALLDPDDPAQPGLKSRIRALMRRIYDEGKQEGYIEESLSFDLLNLYTEIFTAGFQAKSKDLGAVLTDPDTYEQLQRLFFFGFLHKE